MEAQRQRELSPVAVLEHVQTTAVEAAAVNVHTQTTREEPTDAVAMVCDSVCRLFVSATSDVDAWLDGACEQMRRIVRGGKVCAECMGAWAALIEVDHSGTTIAMSIGVASRVSEEHSSELRSRVLAEISSPTFHSGLAHAREAMRAFRVASNSEAQASHGAECGVRLRANSPASAKPLHFPFDPSSLQLGSLGSLIDDGYHGTPLLCAGFVFTDGDERRHLAKAPIVHTMFDAIARIATKLIVRPRAAQRAIANRFSLSQQQVFQLLVLGLTELEISIRLGRSHHTIHDHVRSMYKSLGVSSKTELIARWHSAGAG